MTRKKNQATYLKLRLDLQSLSCVCGLEKKNSNAWFFSLFSIEETLAYDLLLLAANKGIRQFSVEGGIPNWGLVPSLTHQIYLLTF